MSGQLSPSSTPTNDGSSTQAFTTFYRNNERLLLFLYVFFCATVPYFFINRFNDGRPARELNTPLDALIPYQQGWEFVYMSFQLMTFLPFVIARDLDLVRRMVKAATAIWIVAYTTFLILPVQMLRWVDPTREGFVAWGVRLNNAADGPFNCFPSLHVSIAILMAFTAWKADRVVGAIALVQAFLIAVSTLTLKQHYLVDVLAAFVLSGTACHHFLGPYRERGPHVAWPRRTAAILPTLYVIAIALLYGAYQAGVPVAPSKWAHMEIDVNTLAR